MIYIKNKNNGEPIGEITDDDLAFLMRRMEHDPECGNDYYINEDELTRFAEEDGSPAMIELLRANLDDNGELEIEWDPE